MKKLIEEKSRVQLGSYTLVSVSLINFMWYYLGIYKKDKEIQLHRTTKISQRVNKDPSVAAVDSEMTQLFIFDGGVCEHANGFVSSL